MATGWRGSYYRYKQFFLNISELYKKRADLRAFLEIVLSITAIIIFLLYAIKPTALTIVSLVKQINEKKETLTALNKKVADLKNAQNLLTQNEQYLPDIEISVPSLPSPDIFAKQILGLAAKNSIELMGMSIGNINILGKVSTIKSSGELKPLPESANEMGYSISVKGAYANIDSFLNDLENLKLISMVDSVSVSSSQTETGRIIVAIVAGRVPYLGNK